MRREITDTKKVNRKVLYTKKLIRDAFLELLKNKSFEKITVTEITGLADINRSTFYSHYDNCMDLIKEIEVEFAQEIIGIIDKPAYDENYSANVINLFFDTLTENKELSVWFMDDHVTGIGKQMIFDHISKRFTKLWEDKHKLSDDEYQYFLQFLYNGALGFLSEWYRNDFSGDKEKMKKLFKKLTDTTLELVKER
jgi:AcrR family transcriptional regulator